MRTPTFTALASLSLAGCRGAPLPELAPISDPARSAKRSDGATPTVAPTSPSRSSVEDTRSRTFDFDSDRADAAPAGFLFGLTGRGKAGRWMVRAETDAPSRPNVLAQLDADDTDMRFPVAVADAPSMRDARVSVRCKIKSGRVDQACGLVFHYRDADNYFVTRANALENNVRLYTVKDGRRRQLASWTGRVTAGAWHEYAVEVRGDNVQIFRDGVKVLDHHDASVPDEGRAGAWTKADSVTFFDDLRVEAL